MTSSRSARRASRASELGQDEQPWLVNSSTTTGAAVHRAGLAGEVGCAWEGSSAAAKPAKARAKRIAAKRIRLEGLSHGGGSHTPNISALRGSSASHEWVRPR